jgi:ferredoxin-NADP reductase
MVITTGATRGSSSDMTETEGGAPLSQALNSLPGFERLGPTRWRNATVRSVEHSRGRSVKLRLEIPGRADHLPGQHYVIRLTAEDGYQANRSYSVASSPFEAQVEFFVERLEDGEVSTFLADEVRVGDSLEVRGPIGPWFTWDGVSAALAVGGGSGVVPLVAMLRHARLVDRSRSFQLVASARTLDELPYADELLGAGVTVALSRASHSGRPPGRLVAADLKSGLARGSQRVYVCGSAGFTEHAAQLLVDLGTSPSDIRLERFGPSGP